MTAEEGIHALLAHLRLKGYRAATIVSVPRSTGWACNRCGSSSGVHEAPEKRELGAQTEPQGS